MLCVSSVIIFTRQYNVAGRLWLDAAFELVVDKESSVQEKALQFIWEVIMDNISVFDR